MQKYKDNVYFLSDNSIDLYKCVERNGIIEIAEAFLSNIENAPNTLFVFYWGKTESEELKNIKSTYRYNVLVWLGNEERLIPSELIKQSYDVIFKNHQGCVIDNKVLPFALLTPDSVNSAASMQPYIDIADRKYDVFFAGNLNKNRLPFYNCLRRKVPLIERLIEFLSRFKGGSRLFKAYYHRKDRVYDDKTILDDKYNTKIIFNHGFFSGLSPKEYTEILAQSKIVLSPRGFFTTECFRTSEAMRQGCIVITEKLPDVSYYKDIPVITINKWNEIRLVLEKLTSDKEKMKEMSLASVKYYKEKLSLEAIKRYMIKEINNRL
ncbi:hypothetical protein [Segatella bryantii]|uniref:hypothetical protein n=1 Tax=Segatella bryantii TaxID=77095 RepID=UPI0028535CAB|nr:hypothetical protein [Segatella bryantii]MDR4931331.1 hypothetical protein [Segatella bryantii]